MGRGKKGNRLSALAEGGEARPSSRPARAEGGLEGPAAEQVALSDVRAPRMLPQILRPRYEDAEPSAEVKEYARSYAGSIRRGEIRGAVNLLRSHLGALRRGYPALEAVLEALAELVAKESTEHPFLAERRRMASELLGQVPPPAPLDEPELREAVRRALVEGLRGTASEQDVMRAARDAACQVRVKRLADHTAWSLSLKGPDWLVEQWLEPLYLNRFLWRAHGRDYESMPWPFHEQLAVLLHDAFRAAAPDEQGRELRERRLLPALVVSFWPQVSALVASELEERTFSAKWPLELAKLEPFARQAGQ